jgi:cytochrome P450
VSREIDARVDTRLAQRAMQPAPQPRRGPSASPMTLAVISMALGIPISAIAVAAGKHPAGILGLIVVWIAIAAINITYTAWPAGPDARPPDVLPESRRADRCLGRPALRNATSLRQILVSSP